MTADRINYINSALIVFSCIVAFFVPFELFLFSYGVLGPLHYLTEIGWLHKKNYFTKGKYDFVFLIALCTVLFWYNYHPAKGTLIADLVSFALFLSLIFVFIKDWLYRIALSVLALFVIGMLNNAPNYFVWIGIFLPTIIHVFVFTWAFMLYGVLKEKSVSGFLSIGVLILCSITFFVIKPQGLNYHVSDYVQKSYFQFELLNFHLVNIFGMDQLKNVKDIFVANSGFVIMRFIAFAYTYHYLNWFSKTSVIKWHQVPKRTLAITIVLWIGSVALYAVDYNKGLEALFFLSFLHVFLEFPLNVTSFTGIGRELAVRPKK
ncbi:MAG: hypothetical protein ACXVP0_10820 [Bacteroidia bacterium]